MDYTPRHSQPFTLAEAISFDVSVIMEEINRLENSLNKLRETQDFLQSYLEVPDAEIARVLEENKVVIESQEERITILKMALIERGILSASHYETANQTGPSPALNHSQHPDTGPYTIQTPPSELPRQIESEEGDRGVYL